MACEVVAEFTSFSDARTCVLRDSRRGLFVRKSAPLGRAGEKLISQARWYQSNAAENICPRLLGLSTVGRKVFIDIDFIPGAIPLDQRLLQLSESKAIDLFISVLQSLHNKIHRTHSRVEDAQKRDHYIQEKLLGKLEFIRLCDPMISDLMSFDQIVVNGRRLKNRDLALAELLHSPSKMNALKSFLPSTLHGDVTLQNILVSDGRPYFIDPNNENLINSPMVDFAKLLQSLDSGYEFLLQQQQFQMGRDTIDYADLRPARWKILKQVMLEFLEARYSQIDLGQLSFHQSVHLARLLPYQWKSNAKRLPLFYAEFLRKLNDYLEDRPCI